MGRRNLRAGNVRRRQGDPMREFDALPPPLRAWLRQAALPWSAKSALRIWEQACREGGADAALARLAAAEAGTLARDAVIRQKAAKHG
ncbi:MULTISPECIES: DUF6525 family protein [Shimia]|uniref:DUF6525 family protein n=1 Tax=Shimia TaxID=573139 RepID=UPI001FB537A9|nr:MULTISPECIES: DUF6525 family protein [Shimia]MDV4145805.1 DUF6525 family protein [Shimia sp. FJ5]